MNKVRRFVFAVLIFGMMASPPSPAYGDGPDDPLPFKLFLPVTMNHRTFLISGQVTDPQENPLPGVVITDNSGKVVATDTGGNYEIALSEGENALAPSKSGYRFTPSMVDVEVNANIQNQDFIAIQTCSDGVKNGSFEENSWWYLANSEWPAAYTSELAHSGLRSVRSGIFRESDNRYTYSDVNSPAINIPSDLAQVTLRLWLYAVSTDGERVSRLGELEEQKDGNLPETYDAQYVQILDGNDQLLETLLWTQSNNLQWTLHDFDLTKWSGRSIKIRIGAYNDGEGGVTGLYLDDISLEMCEDGGTQAEPLPDSACTNQVVNPGFEYNAAWGIPSTPYPAGYSGYVAASGVRSMRTGIPLYTSSNVFSYSDAWQTVTVPNNAVSAKLRMRLYPRSEQPYASSPAPPPAAGSVWGEMPLASDVQYVLILNPYTGAIRKSLFWETPMNAAGWIYREFDLLQFVGQSIRIQFGTFNNGNDGRTVMYVDDVFVDTCSSVPPPPPPPICTERVKNGGFETSGSWSIPLTNFSAGYSTYRSHSGARSMRTGIVYPYHNRYSYSDFRQTVYVPSNISSAVLGFWAYPSSSEANYSPIPERPTAGEFGTAAMSGDVQYLLVLDYYLNWVDTLLWMRSNANYWGYLNFNLKKYAGQTINLQWGTYNNGWGGVTSMYIDDVSLQACP